MKGLSNRIHHRERVKAKFRRKQKLDPYWGDGPRSEGIYANHGCSCSCWMCGNPRRHHGERTIQERKARHQALDELVQLGQEMGEYD